MSSGTKVKYPGLREGSWFSQFLYGSNPWMARYVYGLMFLVTNFLAWAVRDYGQSAMKEMHSKLSLLYLFSQNLILSRTFPKLLDKKI